MLKKQLLMDFLKEKMLPLILPSHCQRGQPDTASRLASAPSPHFPAWCLSGRCCDCGNCVHSCLERQEMERKTSKSLFKISFPQADKSCHSPIPLSAHLIVNLWKASDMKSLTVGATEQEDDQRRDSLVTATWRLAFPSSITSITSSGHVTKRSVHPSMKQTHEHTIRYVAEKIFDLLMKKKQQTSILSLVEAC